MYSVWICEILSSAVGKLEVMGKSRLFWIFLVLAFSAGFKPQQSSCQIDPDFGTGEVSRWLMQSDNAYYADDFSTDVGCSRGYLCYAYLSREAWSQEWLPRPRTSTSLICQSPWWCSKLKVGSLEPHHSLSYTHTASLYSCNMYLVFNTLIAEQLVLARRQLAAVMVVSDSCIVPAMEEATA